MPPHPNDPEALARQHIDRQLIQCGWLVQSRPDLNITAGLGVAVREFPLRTGYADYLLYVDGKAAGVIEAKPEGHTPKAWSCKPANTPSACLMACPAHRKPPPFAYESTGIETRFTNALDQESAAGHSEPGHVKAQLRVCPPRRIGLKAASTKGFEGMPSVYCGHFV